jgi:hypothetical protein
LNSKKEGEEDFAKPGRVKGERTTGKKGRGDEGRCLGKRWERKGKN